MLVELLLLHRLHLRHHAREQAFGARCLEQAVDVRVGGLSGEGRCGRRQGEGEQEWQRGAGRGRRRVGHAAWTEWATRKWGRRVPARE